MASGNIETNECFCSLQKKDYGLLKKLYFVMQKQTTQQMGGDLTAKRFCASVELLYAADQTDFYLRQNELVAIVIPEVDDK